MHQLPQAQYIFALHLVHAFSISSCEVYKGIKLSQAKGAILLSKELPFPKTTLLVLELETILVALIQS